MKVNTKSNETVTTNKFVDVKNARTVTTQNGKVLVFFTLEINDVTIYDCQIVETKEGKDFVSFPSRKGKDGKYYNYAFVKLDDETTTQIINLVQKALNA